MKTKQKNIRVFELESDNFDEAVSYLEKNSDLLKTFTLALRGSASQKMYEWAKNSGHCAFIAPDCLEPAKAVNKPKVALFKQDDVNEGHIPAIADIASKVAPSRIILNRVLRSGEIIENSGDIVVFGRVNSGAKIICNGCVEIFDEVDGLVECDGDYVLLRSIGKGSVVYKNETIKKELLKYDLQKLYFENGLLCVKKI